MAIEGGYQHNFNTLLRAAGNNDLVLVDCQDKATGKKVVAVCATQFDPADNSTSLIPLAKMFDGDPYEELNPLKGTLTLGGITISAVEVNHDNLKMDADTWWALLQPEGPSEPADWPIKSKGERDGKE